MADVRGDGFSAKTLRIPGYTILGLLGKGGMGAVFRARQDVMDRVVALKVLPPKLAADRNYVERFLREARASAKLNHPNIVQGIDCGSVGDTAYFVMEYVEGSSWGDVIKKQKAIPWRDAVNVAIQIGDALQHASKMGMVHRDIKPDNILLTPRGEAKLVDLGLAKQTQDEVDASLTQAGSAVGTPHYIAPEQAAGKRDVDVRADIYSLGATVYHAITGHTVFHSATTAVAVMASHMAETAPSLRMERPDLPDSVVQVLTKMLAKSPGERYATPDQMVAELQAALDDRPVPKAAAFRGKSSLETLTTKAYRPVAPTGEHKKITRPSVERATKSQPPVLALAGGGAVLLLVIALFALSGSGDKPDAQKPPKKDNPNTVVQPLPPPIDRPDPSLERNRLASEKLDKALQSDPGDAADPIPALRRLLEIEAAVKGTPSESRWKDSVRTATDTIRRFLEALPDRTAVLALRDKYTAEPQNALWEQALKSKEGDFWTKWQAAQAQAVQQAQQNDFPAAHETVKPFLTSEVPAIAAEAKREDEKVAQLEQAFLDQKSKAELDTKLKAERLRYDLYLELFQATANLDVNKAQTTLTKWRGKEEAKPLAEEFKFIGAELNTFKDQIKKTAEEMMSQKEQITAKSGALDITGVVTSFTNQKLSISSGQMGASADMSTLPRELIAKVRGWDKPEKEKLLEYAQWLFWRGQLDGANAALQRAGDGAAGPLANLVKFMISGADLFYPPEAPKELKATVPQNLYGPGGVVAKEVPSVDVDISWKAATMGTQKYEIGRKFGADGAYEKIADADRTASKYCDKEVPLGASVSYQLVACNSAGKAVSETNVVTPKPRSLVPGDFEGNDKDWDLKGSAAAGAVARSGKKALNISGSGGATKHFDVKGGKTYAVSGYIKVIKESGTHWGGVRASIADNASDRQLAETRLFTLRKRNPYQREIKENEWTQFNFTFTAQSDLARLTLETVVQNGVTLEAAIDDVTIKEQ